MIFDQVIDKLQQHFTGGDYQSEVVQAKKEFFEDAGLVGGGDETLSFEVRMCQFLDWYLFTRDLSKYHIPPVHYALESKELTFSNNETELLKNLSNIRHSLFEFIKVRGNDVYVRDLFSGKKICLTDSHVTSGFNNDEVFEARVIPFEKNWVFSKGFCFHPSEVKSFILKEIKKTKNLDRHQQEALMFRLMKMRYKYEQYKHIRLEFIYTNEGKLRI